MKFIVFDKNEIQKGTLKDVIDAIHTEEINGEDVLNITTLDTLQKGDRILYQDRYGYYKEFIVKKGESEHEADDCIINTYYCESSFYETFGDYIEDKRPYNVTANAALEVALFSTRWEVGIVEDLGINSVNFYRTNVKTAIADICKAWKAELRTRVEVSSKQITHRYVDLLSRRGSDRGKRYRYSKDLNAVKRIFQSDDVVTALYGYGKGEEIGEGYGRRIDFADIEWSIANGDPIDKPLGQTWIGLDSVKEVWGRNSTSGKVHVFGKIEFDDIEDSVELLQATYETYLDVSKPKFTYEGSVTDLREAKGLEHEGVELGDDAIITDEKFKPELRVKGRVLKYVTDLLNPINDEILLGNFIDDLADESLKNAEHINNFRGKQGVWDRSQTINSDGTINAQFLNNLVDELNARMNSQGGYVYISEEGKGLITYDKPNPEDATMAIQLLGGAFRIAGSKLPNGEFNWRTFGDGNGFVADAFIGGLLKGGKVHFDLTNGTLLIGDSISNYSLFFDGTDLHIGGGMIKSSNYSEVNGIVSQGTKIDLDSGGIYTRDLEVNGALSQHDLNSKYKSISLEHNEVRLYDWNTDGRHIGSIGTTVDSSGSDATMWAKQGHKVVLGIENPSTNKITPILTLSELLLNLFADSNFNYHRLNDANLYWKMADSDYARIIPMNSGTDKGSLEIATADNGDEPINVRQYTGQFANVVNTLTLLDGSGNTWVPKKLYIDGWQALDTTNIKHSSIVLTTDWQFFAFNSVFEGSPSVVLTPNTSNTGVIAGKIRNVTKNGFEACIGGTGASASMFDYIAFAW